MIPASRVAATLDAAPRELLIDNKWCTARSGRTFSVENPANGEAIAEVADADPADGLHAVEAAHRAQESWAGKSPRERGEVLLQAQDALLSRADDLALLITLEMGKPYADAVSEVAYAADYLRWYAEEAVRLDGTHRTTPDGRSRLVTFRQPVGVCLLITPWNFPLAMAARKVAPALAAGCTTVVKPAEETPLTALAFADVLLQCGVPAGVVNVVTTSRAGELVGPLLKNPRLRKLSFTGSTDVGKLLIAQSADQVLRTSMELGGNAPFLVFADADLDAAVEGAVLAKMRNVGQACTAANRFYVEAEVAPDFVKRLGARVAELAVGPGIEDDVAVGPLVNQAARDKVDLLVNDAVHAGASIATGGTALARPGYFYAPTVLADVPAIARLNHHEIFGPVAPVSTFRDEDDAIRRANDTPFGLAAYVYTGNTSRAFRVCERLQVGMVGLNQGMVSNAAAPFGGIKQSGFGREGGRDGIDEYLDTKFVALPR